MEGRKYGAEDDVWALGVLLTEIASLHHKPQYSVGWGKWGAPLFTAEQVTAGEHLKVVSHLSVDAQNLLNALLEVDETKRPTI